ncbi:MAG TPA: indolepyruvate oxidoreductase subunit beta family protein [Steroidobacteraceae bacterium]|nr:indolepyruvate oxidoreductase subunit beta family protein [Steroidobacteraceae bacterium]
MSAQPLGRSRALSADKPISIAILAMGGQGGGVLSNWIVALAESQGWAAQSTSVPGVAQRTGATIYYIEILAARAGKRPIFALMPTPGDVDIVIAAELMEAGRAMLRGLLSPDRTTLIASTHRSLAVVEKQVPGDGIADPTTIVEAAEMTARRVIAFDMQRVAEGNGGAISAAMLGVLAAADILPFARSAFESAIREEGKGVESSLRTFSAAFERTRERPREAVTRVPDKRLPTLPASAGHPTLDRLLQRIRAGFPSAVQAMVFTGVKRVVDYQDSEYGNEYLDRLEKLHRLDVAHGGAKKEYRFTVETAKYLAVAMTYEDVVRVADLKVRASRFRRVRAEIGVKNEQIVHLTEYMHPRMEEVMDTLPAPLGRFLERRPRLFRALDRIVSRGRRVRTDSLRWFIALYALASAKAFRRASLRHARELAHIERWTRTAAVHLPGNYDLATEVVACRRLIKGYSDTHARGNSKFDRVLGLVPRLESLPDAADWLRRLREAALADEQGEALDSAVKALGAAASR